MYYEETLPNFTGLSQPSHFRSSSDDDTQFHSIIDLQRPDISAILRTLDCDPVHPEDPRLLYQRGSLSNFDHVNRKFATISYTSDANERSQDYSISFNQAAAPAPSPSSHGLFPATAISWDNPYSLFSGSAVSSSELVLYAPITDAELSARDPYPHEATTQHTSHDSSTEDSDADPEGPETYRKKVTTAATQRSAEHRRKYEAKFHCPRCNSTFTTARNKRHHENAHKGIKDFSCSECHLPMATPSNVMRHGKKKHPVVRAEPVQRQ